MPPPEEEITEQTISSLEVLELLPGTPGKLVAAKVSRGLHGSQPIVLQTLVPDENLWGRLCAAVQVGDRLDVTIETHWTQSGYTNTLVGFTLASGTDPAPD
jgi:hypothetical protein